MVDLQRLLESNEINMEYEQLELMKNMLGKEITFIPKKSLVKWQKAR
jgi:hypothetical protein